MLKALLFGVAVISTVYGQATTPYLDTSVCFTEADNGGSITFIADAQNSCWYWQCRNFRGQIRVIERECPLGSAVSSFFGASSTNPCTEIFDPNAVKFDCTRKEFNIGVIPPCVEEYEQICKNDGKVVYDLSVCYCDCTGTGFIDWDCSRREEDVVTPPDVFPNPDDPCPDGIPKSDWCALAGGNPCQNNGKCTNQCLEYVCQCIAPFTAGRNCEEFFCTDNVECLNGGTCSRGTGADATQYATCECLPGFTGLMCELSAAN